MKKLLIADDNLDYLGLLVSVFEKHFEVYEASGVKEALSLLEDKEVDAICSDFNLRDGTGLDLLKEIRQKNLTYPFLLMSVMTIGCLKKRLNITADHSVVKPIMTLPRR